MHLRHPGRTKSDPLAKFLSEISVNFSVICTFETLGEIGYSYTVALYFVRFEPQKTKLDLPA